MTVEYGVWSEQEDGFLTRQNYSIQEAENDLAFLAAEQHIDADDLSVREICPDHSDEEQPKEGCDLCDAEDEDEEDE